jgi:TPP-dependent pyruvate/acetoin dehydrogenase alpha subunit
MRGSKSLIENPDFSSGTYRTRAIYCMRDCQHPPFLSRTAGEEGGRGEGEGARRAPQHRC